jgi:putative DNA primase/helicase
MNKEYAHVVIGAQHKIMVYKPCPINGFRMTFERINDFYRYFDHTSKIADKNQGAAWYKWAGKTFCSNGLGYYPDVKKLPAKVFNTFRGFGCEPNSGDVSLILQHINDGLCSGDKKASTYFIQWLAHIFQKPAQKPSVAVLMKSAEGTGKGTIFTLLRKMLGANSHQVNGSYQLTGRFNGVVAGKLLIFADEVDMTDKGVFDRAKGIISEDTISLELKGIDPEPIPNLARFIFAGNHDRILRAGTRERRFLVLEPSDKMIDKQEYWQALNAQIEKGGAPAFMDYLLNLDITHFNPYKAPTTQGLISEKLMSLSDPQNFVYSELVKPKPFNGAVRLYATSLIDDYRNWADANNLKISEPTARSQMGKMLKGLNIESQGRSDRGEGVLYQMPELDTLRQAFAKQLGHSKEDIF